MIFVQRTKAVHSRSLQEFQWPMTRIIRLDIKVARQRSRALPAGFNGMSAGLFLKAIYRFTRPSTRRDPGASAEREENMVTKLAALLSVLAVGGGLSTAVAQQAPTENKGMKVEALSGFALGKQGLDDLAQRQMRIRQITIEPGGVAAFHSHKDRPALSYIMKGSLTEHRKGGPDRTYKAGEVITESTDVDHWAENASSEPVILISADLFKE
jgi:quercetin dioxygenase-like cupin family protein